VRKEEEEACGSGVGALCQGTLDAAAYYFYGSEIVVCCLGNGSALDNGIGASAATCRMP
jgi:hypothetical protein